MLIRPFDEIPDPDPAPLSETDRVLLRSLGEAASPPPPPPPPPPSKPWRGRGEASSELPGFERLERCNDRKRYSALARFSRSWAQLLLTLFRMLCKKSSRCLESAGDLTTTSLRS